MDFFTPKPSKSHLFLLALSRLFSLFFMESKKCARLMLWKQSSLAPERHSEENELQSNGDAIDPGMRLMYWANEGDLNGIREVSESGVGESVDGHMALHVTTCQDFIDVVDLLIQKGAEVDPKDRWESTPLADAIYHKSNDVIKLLEKHGAKPLMATMHVDRARDVPEHEINPKGLDFTNSMEINKGAFCSALWRGTEVAVKS